MIADLLPGYYERYEPNVRYSVLRSIVIDGHEVAWMSYIGTVQYDITGNGHEGEPFSGRTMMCECDFTKDVGWSVGDNGLRYTLDGPRACLIRRAALYLRHLELRAEYTERFVKSDPNSFLGLKGCMREITLDLIEKGQAGEWLEDGDGARMYGGHFYLQTLATITDEFMGHLWEDMYPLMEDKLIELDGTIVKAYTKPPLPEWEEYLRIEEDGWVGIASLPGHRRMAQEWKLDLIKPDGMQVLYVPGLRLLHDPVFGPDVEDMERVTGELRKIIEVCRTPE